MQFFFVVHLVLFFHENRFSSFSITGCLTIKKRLIKHPGREKKHKQRNLETERERRMGEKLNGQPTSYDQSSQLFANITLWVSYRNINEGDFSHPFPFSSEKKKIVSTIFKIHGFDWQNLDWEYMCVDSLRRVEWKVYNFFLCFIRDKKRMRSDKKNRSHTWIVSLFAWLKV